MTPRCRLSSPDLLGILKGAQAALRLRNPLGHVFQTGNSACLVRAASNFRAIIYLLAVGLSLVFVAIPLASSDAAEWRRAHILTMIIIGGLCFVAFYWYKLNYPE